MRLLKTLFLVLALVTASNAQQSTEQTQGGSTRAKPNLQSLGSDVAEPEVKPLAIDERPDAQAIAAIAAVKEGNDLWRQGKSELAAASYEKAVKLQPELYAAHFNLGMAKLQLKKFSEAVTAFE